jgi:hypothetical protein
MKKKIKDPTSLEAEYFINEWRTRKPNDSLRDLAKRCNINPGTLHKLFYTERMKKEAFTVSHYLFDLCTDIGITMESVLHQNPDKYDRDIDINHWKSLYFKEVAKREEIETRHKEQLKRIIEIARKK